MGWEKGDPSLLELGELVVDYALHEARTSRKYSATMVDMVEALNRTNITQLRNIDVEEIRNQAGHLAYFEFKDVESPVPCDIDFFPKLHGHLRRPSLMVLRRIRRFLMAPHRRVLSQLEKEHSFEKFFSPQRFNVDFKVKLAIEEMNRYRKMSDMVRGGGRKLDILMEGLLIPARVRFEIFTMKRMLLDRYNPSHTEVMEWLKSSQFQGEVERCVQYLDQKLFYMEMKSDWFIQKIEDLSGVGLKRDESEVDITNTWYSLGQATPRGDDFFHSFSKDEEVEQKIRRLTFPMVKVQWDAERLRYQRDQVLLKDGDPQERVLLLSRVVFDVDRRIESCTAADSDVMGAIEADFERGLLSKREYREAYDWVQSNKIKLENLLLDTYETLHKIVNEHEGLTLPGEIEETIARVQSSVTTDQGTQAERVEKDLEQFSPDMAREKIASLEALKEDDPQRFLREAVDLWERMRQFARLISMQNVEFHQRIREIHKDFSEYETRVLDLMQMESEMEALRCDLERDILGVYRVIPYGGLHEKTLEICLDLAVKHMLLAVRKLDFAPIDATVLSERVDAALKGSDDESVVKLDPLLREIQAIPRASQILSTIGDWEKDLEPKEVNEKKEFIETNEEGLQKLAQRIRAELRERVADSELSSPRLRFEVFGLSECLAENLAKVMHALMEILPKVTQASEGERLAANLKALENQVIEAQKMVRPDGEAYQKLKKLEAKGQVSERLLRQLHGDLQANFRDLDSVLGQMGEALKRVVLHQNRFGAGKETDYLDVTVNVDDLDKLRDLYQFLETTNLEDIKRFCVAYNLKNSLFSDLMMRARKRDVSLSKEIVKAVNTKVFKVFKETRFVPPALRTLLFLKNQEVFEAECNLLCHTLNLVRAAEVRDKATYKAMLMVFAQASKVPEDEFRGLKLLWGRLHARLFSYEPNNHKANYEGNRTALMTDVKEESRGKLGQ